MSDLSRVDGGWHLVGQQHGAGWPDWAAGDNPGGRLPARSQQHAQSHRRAAAGLQGGRRDTGNIIFLNMELLNSVKWTKVSGQFDKILSQVYLTEWNNNPKICPVFNICQKIGNGGERGKAWISIDASSMSWCSL